VTTLLRELGTVAFDLDIMRRCIGFGRLEEVDRIDEAGTMRRVIVLNPRVDSGAVQFGLWLLLVPETYRPMAMRCVQVVGERFMRELATPKMLMLLISELQTECVREIHEQRQEGY
jgi:hypothetical protein